MSNLNYEILFHLIELLFEQGCLNEEEKNVMKTEIKKGKKRGKGSNL